MFERIIKFFINNPKFNYTLFFLLFAIGIYSYQKMPKEMFPTTEMDVITVSGGYVGSSINTLDKMIVKDLEEDILNIEEVKELDTVISPGKFSISATLKDNVDKRTVLDDIETSIKRYKINLPFDMNEPIAIIGKFTRPTLFVAITSDKVSRKVLIDTADEIKNKLYQVSGVGDVNVYGATDEIVEFTLLEKNIEAFNLNKSAVINVISNLSYTFPVGSVKDNKSGHYYISMNNGNNKVDEFKNTILRIGNKEVYLKDISKINYTLKEDSASAYVNGKPSIVLAINQLDTADAISLVNDLRIKVDELNEKYVDYALVAYNDKSIPIKNRLNTVVSNILFGMILVILSLYVLVNKRLSFVIGLGIPTSFVIAFAVAYNLGFTINLVSLLGLLIALGIVVDDAIVVGENIQRHIEMGDDKKTAALRGTMEMFEPVVMASLTTLFAFLPMLMISGQMGKFIILIPLMVSFLIIASLIDVFIFLPIHAEHTLSKKDSALSWDKVNNLYFFILKYTIHFKKTFLTLFFILVPLLTILILKNSSFQMFPSFDASEFTISGKLSINNDLESTTDKIKPLNEFLLRNKDEFFIESFTTIVGARKLANQSTENGENMFKIDIELEPHIAENFVDSYINPIFAIEEISDGKRDIKSQDLAQNIRLQIKDMPVYNLFEEFDVLEKKVGPVRSDIHIALISEEQHKIIESVKLIQEKLEAIDGIKDISNDIALGVPELKLKINKYGESLGLTERKLGQLLSSIYLENKTFNIFTEKELLEVNFVSEFEDNLEEFKNKSITLDNGKMVILNDIVEFNRKDSFIKVLKQEGSISKNIFANVNGEIITSTDVLELLQSTFDDLEKKGVKVLIKGEQEKNKEFANDMKRAAILALMLITLAMLYMFNKFSYVFIILSVIPFSIIGALLGHIIMGMNLSMPSMIGILGLAGVVINDSIIMLSFIEKAKDSAEFFKLAILRFRPIILTSVTTLIGLSTLIFFATGQAKILQPIAISLGFGLAWGTIVNLLYVPALFAVINKFKH